MPLASLVVLMRLHQHWCVWDSKKLHESHFNIALAGCKQDHLLLRDVVVMLKHKLMKMTLFLSPWFSRQILPCKVDWLCGERGVHRWAFYIAWLSAQAEVLNLFSLTFISSFVIFKLDFDLKLWNARDHWPNLDTSHRGLNRIKIHWKSCMHVSIALLPHL